MNKYTVVAQNWIESELGWGQRPDGYSLHLTVEDRDTFVKEVLDHQREVLGEETPECYTFAGASFPVTVGERVYSMIKDSGGSHGIWGRARSVPGSPDLIYSDLS